MAAIKDITKALKANNKVSAKASKKNAKGIEKLTDAIGQMTSRLEMIAENQTIIATRQNKWFKPLSKIMNTPKLIKSAISMIKDNPITRLTSAIVEAVVFPFKTVTKVMKSIFGMFKKTFSIFTAPFKWLFGRNKEGKENKLAADIQNKILAEVKKLNALMSKAFSEDTKEQKKKKRNKKQDDLEATETERENKRKPRVTNNPSLPILPIVPATNGDGETNTINSAISGAVAGSVVGIAGQIAKKLGKGLAGLIGSAGLGLGSLIGSAGRGLGSLISTAPAAARAGFGNTIKTAARSLSPGGILAKLLGKLALPLALIVPDDLGDGSLQEGNMTPRQLSDLEEQRRFSGAEAAAERARSLAARETAYDDFGSVMDKFNRNGAQFDERPLVIIPQEPAAREAQRMLQRKSAVRRRSIADPQHNIPSAMLAPSSFTGRNSIRMTSALEDLNKTMADLKAYLANPSVNVVDTSSSQVVNNSGSTVNVGKSTTSGDPFNGGIGLRQ